MERDRAEGVSAFLQSNPRNCLVDAIPRSRQKAGGPTVCDSPVMTAPSSFDVARLRGLVQLAAPTAHDLRGCCGTVAVHLELLATGLADLPASERDRCSSHVAVIQREMRDLLAAAEAFLAMVAPADQTSQFDLAALVAETAHALRPFVKQRRLELAVARPSLPVPVTADRERLRQDILELLLPILGASPPSSRVSVALAAAVDGGILTVDRPDAGPLVVSLPRRPEAEA